MADPGTDEFKDVNPATEGVTPTASKLPPPMETGNIQIDTELKKAWAQHMLNGYNHGEELFRTTLDSYMSAYKTTLLLNKIMFGVGILLFLVAVGMSLITGQWQFALIFGGLGLGLFLAYFISRPMQAIEENQEFIAWLGVAYNTYWARLMYSQNQSTVLQDIKAAGDDFSEGIQKLIEKHAELRGKRPASDIADK